MKSGIRRMLAVVATAALCPQIVLAQSDARPAPGTVFGGAAASTDRQTLNLTVDVNESYDQNVTLRSGADAVSLFQGSGSYLVVTPTLDFASHGDRVQLAVTAGSNARYYTDLDELLVTNETAAAGLTLRLSPATMVSFNQNITYTAALLSGLFAAEVAPAQASPTSNYALNASKSYASTTGANIIRRISRRATMSFASDLQYTVTARNANYPNVQSHDVGGLFSYSLTRDLSLKAGYTFKQGEYEGTPPSTQHDLNLGIAYSRPLSRTRRIEFAFTVGPSIISAPLTFGSVDVRRQYRLVADMALKHQIARTWALHGTFHRGTGYIQGFQSPVFSESYSAGVGGFLTRRTDLSMSAAYSTGESALLTGTPDQFKTYTGDVKLRFAMNRMWATYVEYLLYYYDFNRASTFLPAGLPPGLTRNGLRTGVIMWIPVRHR